MRVVSVDQNDLLADAVVDIIDFGVDDIATPGSFWLNPPHPRDDEGNAVDPYNLAYGSPSSSPSSSDDNEIDDDQLRAILADLAPLK